MTAAILGFPLVSSDLVSVILGAGGLSFLLALGAGIRWMFDRASAREDKVERQNKDYQRRLNKRLRYEAQMHDYYRVLASRLESVILRDLDEEHLPERPRMPRWVSEDDGSEDDQKALRP